MRISHTNWPLNLTLAWSLLLGAGSPCPARAASSDDDNRDSSSAKTSETTAEEPDAANSNKANHAVRRGRLSAKSQLGHPRGAGEVVVFGNDAEVKEGETVESVSVFGGSATIHGKVRDDVVAFGGNVDVDGEIGGNAVAFRGDVTVQSNAVVKGDVAAFLGGVEVQPNATVNGDGVAFGGKVDVADGGTVKGSIVPFKIGTLKMGLPKWLQGWLTQCVFKLRPLALQVGWVWVVAGVFFAFYLLIAAAFPRPVQACVDELSHRPATTFLLGLVTKLIVPLVILLLAVTGLGVLVVPFILIALFLGAAVGKVALLQWLGLRIGRQFGMPALQTPVPAFIIGAVILTLLYLVWVVGLLAYVLFSIWGLGVAVTAAFAGVKREMPEKPMTIPPVPQPPVMPTAPVTPMFAAPPAAPGVAAQPPPLPQSAPRVAPPTLPEAWSYPKAGFWERMGAAFLDVVLVSILSGLVHAPFSMLARFLGGPPFGLFIALAYFAGLWTWKGTTIGGIVLGLRVARADGQPLTFSVALVRALAAAFSVVVLFLGFLWIAWDRDKQGWHDRIAGTFVLRMPRGTPLICL